MVCDVRFVVSCDVLCCGVVCGGVVEVSRDAVWCFGVLCAVVYHGVLRAALCIVLWCFGVSRGSEWSGRRTTIGLVQSYLNQRRQSVRPTELTGRPAP